MVASEPAELPIPRRRIRPVTVFVILATVLAALLVVGVAIGFLISKQKVNEEVARIRAAGEPVTPEDLEAYYSLPPRSRDATALWLAAAEAVSQPIYEADARRIPLVGVPNPDATAPEMDLPAIGEPWLHELAVEQFLGKHVDILATIHEAAALGGEARFPTRFDEGVTMSLDSQIHLRDFASRHCELTASTWATRILYGQFGKPMGYTHVFGSRQDRRRYVSRVHVGRSAASWL